MERWDGFRTILDIETSGIDERVYPYSFNQNYYRDFLDSTRRDFRRSQYFQSKFDPDLIQPYQLTGFHARGLLRNKTWDGFQSNDPLYIPYNQDQFSWNPFARDTGILRRSQQRGRAGLTEEAVGHAFYTGISRKIQTHGKVRLEGWHIASHLSQMEALTYRYESLGRYRGFFAKEADQGRFEMRGVEEDLLKTVWHYGQANPEYAAQNFRWTHDAAWKPQSWEDLRRVKFWSLDNVVASLGGWEQFGGKDNPQGHTQAQEHLRSIFSRMEADLATGLPVSKIAEGGTKIEGKAFFDNLFREEKQFPARREFRFPAIPKAAEELTERLRPTSLHELVGAWRTPTLAVAGFGAAAIALGLAFGKRKDRQTQMEALRHEGWAGAARPQNTDFGSGWRGVDEQTSTQHAWLLSAGLGVGYTAHTLALQRNPRYASALYRVAQEIERRSPRNVLSTLGLSQRASQYLPDSLVLKERDLLKIRGTSLAGQNLSERTRLGAHLERLLPGFNVEEVAGKRIEFKRLQANSPYLRLHLDGKSTPYQVSFFRTGVWSKASERYGAEIGSTTRQTRKSLRWVNPADAQALWFQPFHGRTDGRRLRDLLDASKRESFVLNDRLNRMLREFHWPGNHHLHLGIEEHEFNSSVHLIGQLLTRRALPVAAGIASLAYGDYLLGHTPSNTLLGLAAQGRVAWAEATDRVPGARRVTDWYQEHTPGAQYGPLALPAAGAFAGGLLHYSRILAGETLADEVRTLRGRKYAMAGFLAGSLLALPFVPGMLGSRKTAAQVRAEYAGDIPVPVRSGRWWQMGCQHPDNTHLTEDGRLLTVSKVYKEKAVILNGKGQFEKPSSYMKYAYSGPMYRFEIAGQVQKQSFTPNHEILIYRDRELNMIRADEIVKGDFVVLNRLKPNPVIPTLDLGFLLNPSPSGVTLIHDPKIDRYCCQQTNWYTKRPQRSGKHTLPKSIELNRDFGFLVGHFIAEGSRNSNERGHNGVEHACHVKEIPAIERIADIYRKLFGCETKIRPVDKKTDSKKNSWKLRVTSRSVAVLFDHLFYQTSKKVLPLWLIQLGGDEFRKGILEGWFYGDGHFIREKSDYNSISGLAVTSKYIENMYALRILFSQFDCAPTCWSHDVTEHQKPAKTFKKNKYLGYRSYIRSRELTTLIRKHGVEIRKYEYTCSVSDIHVAGFTQKYGVLDDYIYYMVEDIQVTDEKVDVFDFTLDSDHQYETAEYVTHNSNAFSGNRIIAWKPSWYALHTSRAEDKSIYGTEEEKWAHNPLLHPLRWFKDPNWLAEKHSADRPYPMTSPAFSNVPLIGPTLAATLGRIVAPPKRLHEQEWDGSEYTLYTKAVEPKSPRALAPTHPHEEFDTHHLKHHAEEAFEEAIGLPGFLLKTLKSRFKSGDDPVPHVYFEGTRNITSWARRYYERELGAIPGWHPEQGIAGYSEPIRRFVTHERDTPRVNELKNQMPSWLPGSEYFIDFQKGDPYARLPFGFARLPGQGYEALHPEVTGINPEDYPDLEKLRILGDVAPYSLQFRQMAKRVGKAAHSDKTLEIEYQRILDRADQTKQSSVRFDRRHTGETEEASGTIESASESEIRLKEYPGQTFTFSGVGLKASDLASYSLGQSNREIAAEVTRRETERGKFLRDALAPGTNVRLVLPKGALSTTRSQAVVLAKGENLNRQLIERGYGTVDLGESGAEAQALDGAFGKTFRRYAEAVSFQGDEAWYNPLRYLPASMHAKLWNERTALDQYLNQEVLGTKMRRWQRPVHDFLDPYLHSAAYRLTGRVVVPDETQEKRDLDTVTDQLQYLRELYGAANDPGNRQKHWQEMGKTSIGANLFGETDTLPRTLSGTDRKYFREFVQEKNPDERERIMAAVSSEMADTLMAQWTKEANAVKRARGRSVEDFAESGRLVTQLDIDKITDFSGKVVKVIDGDSILVHTKDGDREVRLANINSREIPTKQGFVDKDMTTKLALGQHVRAHEIGQDKYDRHVSDVFFDDKRLLNFELLNSGHADKDVYRNRDGSNQDKLSVGDYFRSREIAQFFHRRGLKLPDANSEIVAPDIDYEDVKVKIVQWEGHNLHDFGIYDDRANMMWRKPYLDGAVRELTSGDARSVEQTTLAIEQAIIASKRGGAKPDVRASQQASRQALNTIDIKIKVDADEEIKQDVRRNREDYT